LATGLTTALVTAIINNYARVCLYCMNNKKDVG
jgi:hypothetical protein